VALVVHMRIPLPAFEAAVEGLCGVNCVLLDALGSRLTPLYESHIRYREPGTVKWQTVADLYDDGWGDCKSLVAARVAELRVYEAEPAMPRVYLTGREHRYHAVVVRDDGTIEDPSAILIAAEREERRQR
jgi:hypothetical protein